MAKTKEQKQEILENLNEKLSKAKMAILTEYKGLKVSEIAELRNEAHESGVNFNVAKINLLKMALEKNKLSIGDVTLEGKPIAIGYGYEDEVTPAKILYNFSKGHENLKILGGILDGEFIDAENIKTLALLPGREELYAKVVGSLAAPISGFVNVLAGNLRGLVSVLNQYKDLRSP